MADDVCMFVDHRCMSIRAMTVVTTTSRERAVFKDMNGGPCIRVRKGCYVRVDSADAFSTLWNSWTTVARARILAVCVSAHREPGACQFFCVWGLEVGGDSVGVGGGELGEGLFPVGGGASLDEACGGCSFVGGFAGVCEALGGSFIFDVANSQP